MTRESAYSYFRDVSGLNEWKEPAWGCIEYMACWVDREWWDKEIATWSLLTSYITPPQVRGIKKLVVAATNRNEPNQSKDLSLWRIEPSRGFSFRQTGIPIKPKTQKGKFNQKIHLHVFSANTPPTSWNQYCLDRWNLELRQWLLSRTLSRHI